MKLRTFALPLALLSATAIGQEPPLPAATSSPTPSASARPELNLPDIPVEPSPLVPNTAATPKKSLPSIQELDTAFQHSSLGAAVEEQKLHLEWRRLQNRASQDAGVIAAKKAINGARTDPEKRDLTRAYYKMFYGRMLALAETPEVKVYLEQKKKNAINSLSQPHLRPEATPEASPKP